MTSWPFFWPLTYLDLGQSSCCLTGLELLNLLLDEIEYLCGHSVLTIRWDGILLLERWMNLMIFYYQWMIIFIWNTFTHCKQLKPFLRQIEIITHILIWGNIKHIFTFSFFPPHWYDTSGRNPSSNKTRTHPFYIVNFMTAGVLATQGAFLMLRSE